MMMKKHCILGAVLSFMAVALVVSSCTKEDNLTEVTEGSETATAVTIPYTVTVSKEPETRATVDSDMKTLRFAEGDKLYIYGLNLQGVLDLRTGIGETSGVFSGHLTYTGEKYLLPILPMRATLVSAQQTVGKEVSFNEIGIASVNYPKNEYIATVEEAVQRYSDLAVGLFYSMKSITLKPKTAFLNFEITFEDDTAAGTEIPAVVTVDSANGPLCSGTVTTRDEGGKVVARFVLPVAGSSTLKNASVKLGTRDAFPFGTENSQVLDGKVYNVIRTSKFSSSLGAMPLTVKALTAGTVKVVIDGTLSSGMKYSVNGGGKTLITTSTDIPVSAGDWVWLYGNGTETQAYGNYPEVKIQGTGEGFKCKVYGNIMSLLDEDGFATKTDLPNQPRVFNDLFRDNTALIDAGDLLLPATTLSSECYCNMFAYCSALTTAPELPATTLAVDCYTNMFFRCGALTTAPELPATTLARSCYYNMFYGCSALTTAPDLLATTLVEQCYYGMFRYCTNLNSVKCLATSGIGENGSTNYWFEDASATGTFHLAYVIWPEGVSGIPGGWTGKYPNGSTMSSPHPLAEATSRDLGKVVGADGNIYDLKDVAAYAGTTAVAVIARKDNLLFTDHFYQAIAISDESEDMYWYAAKSACEGKAPVPGGTWRFPSMAQWKALFAANGGDEFSWAGLNRIITNAGGTAMSRNFYWTSTDVSDKDGWAYDIQRDDDYNKVRYRAMPKGGIRDYVRAVLVFYGRPG